MKDQKLIYDWINYQEMSRKENPNAVKFEWAADEIMDLSITDVERCWDFILAVLEKSQDEWVLTNLGAGPIEDMMVTDSEHTLKLIKSALPNARLSYCLENVWQNLISDDAFFQLKRFISESD